MILLSVNHLKGLLREWVWREQCRDIEADKLGILLSLEPHGDGRGKDLAGVQHAGQQQDLVCWVLCRLRVSQKCDLLQQSPVETFQNRSIIILECDFFQINWQYKINP